MKHAPCIAAAAVACRRRLAAGDGSAQAQSRVEVGVLTCTGARRPASSSPPPRICAAASTGPGRDEFYHGTINKFGIDIGSTKAASIAWAVLAPTANLPRRSLSGTYGGVSAEATVGVGVGANALIGGSAAARSSCSR